MGDQQQSGPDLFKPLLQLRMDGAIREKLSSVHNFTQAARIRAHADRVQAMAAGLRASAEQGAASAIAGELQQIAGAVAQSVGELKATSGMLFGLAQAQFGAGFGLQMSADKALLDAHFWRNRIVSCQASSLFNHRSSCFIMTIKTCCMNHADHNAIDRSILHSIRNTHC